MITLALEFSSPRRSVAVLGPGPSSGGVGSAVLGVSSDAGNRSAKPLQLVEAALHQARVEREAIERVVVGLGPGSYTGIRSAIALAQGWQLARSVQLIGVSTVECLAAQAHAKQWFGQVQVLIDAQRKEFYLAGYQIGAAGWREIQPLRLATLQEVIEILRTREASAGPVEEPAPPVTVLIGPEVDRWFPEGRLLFPEADALGQLAWGRTEFVSGERLEPIYLRPTSFVKAPPPRIVP